MQPEHSLTTTGSRESVFNQPVTNQPLNPLYKPVPNSPEIVMTDSLQQQIDEHRKKLDQATKYDSGKTEWDLLPWDSLEEIIKVLKFGAGKYDPWNWAENGGFKYSRLFNSSMRHLIAWFWRKEDLDPETGISHLAHLGCNVLFLLHYVLNKDKFNNNDNRRV